MPDSPFPEYLLHVGRTADVDLFALIRKDCRHVPQSPNDGLLVFLRDEDGAEYDVDFLGQRLCPAFEAGVGCIHRRKPFRVVVGQAACPECGKGDFTEDKADDADLYRIGRHLAGGVEQRPLQRSSVVGVDVVRKTVFETGDDIAAALGGRWDESLFPVYPSDVHVSRHRIFLAADAKMFHPVQVVFVPGLPYVMAFRLEWPGEFWQHFHSHACSKQL